MDDDRLDLRALDPSTDAARWERMVASVVARGLAARNAASRRLTISDLLAAWRRPMLVLAAVLALVAVPVMLFVDADLAADRPARVEVAQVVVDWAWSGQAQPLDLLNVLGR